MYINAQAYEQTLVNSLDKTIEELTNGKTNTPRATYRMGELVTLGGEEFWVIEDSDATTATVKLLARLNVITTEGNANRYKQDASANTLAYNDNNINDYATSQIKPHVDAYKLAVEGRMNSGKKIQEARLMTGTKDSGELGALLNSTLANKMDIVYGPETARIGYWLYEPTTVHPHGDYAVGEGTTWLASVKRYEHYGLRPVLVVLKSNI